MSEQAGVGIVFVEVCSEQARRSLALPVRMHALTRVCRVPVSVR